MSNSRLLEITNEIFFPPFKRLGWVIWGYVVFCVLINPSSQIIQGNLPHPDDYTYLVQALDWVHGQPWADGLQHRIDPSPLDPLPISRFLTVAYGILIWWLSPLLGDVNSATLIAAFMPLLYLGLFLATLKWAAKPFMHPSWTGVTAYMSLFALSVLAQFAPGTVTEFGLEIIDVTAALGCVGRMISDPSMARWPLAAAAILSFGELLGGQALVPVFAFSLWLGIWAISKGSEYARSSCWFALGLFGLSSFLFILANPWDLGPRIDVWDYFKIYAFVSSALFICFVSCMIISQIARLSLRYVVAVLLVGAVYLDYNHFFPLLVKALVEIISPQYVASALVALKHIPLPELPQTFFQQVSFYLWSVMALAATFFHILSSDEKERRWLWAGMAILISFFGLLAVVFQPGLIIFAETFSIIPLSAFLQIAWQKLPLWFGGKTLAFARGGLVILLGPLATVVLTASVYGRPVMTGAVLFPNQFINYPCDMQALTIALDLPNGYGARPLHILNPIPLGPELLFRTSHWVSGAPYETVDRRLSHSDRFFSTTSLAEAEDIARSDHGDLVVLCNDLPASDLASSTQPQPTSVDGEQKSEIVTRNPELSLGQQLMAQQTPPPAWLHRLQFPFLKNMMAWEVVLPKKTEETSGASQ